MMEHTVLLTVSGDADTAEVHADTTVPLGELVGSWASRCSTRPPEELVAVSSDTNDLYDPMVTLGDLGLGYGSTIRLITTDEALGLLDVQTVEAPPVAPVGPPPPPPGQTTPSPSARPQRGVEAPQSGLGGPASPLPTPRPGIWNSNNGTDPSAGLPSPPDQQDTTSTTAPPQPASPPASSLRHPEDVILPARVGRARRMWRAIRAGLSPSSVPAQQSGAFAKVTQPRAAARYRLALQETNREHNLEVLIRQATLTRCMVIAVVSPKGGPGKTTITALLGMLLAELRRDPVLALDANPDLGDLRDKLAVETAPAMCVDDLARWLQSNPTATPAQLSAHLGVGPHGLRFVPTPRPPTPHPGEEARESCSIERMIAAADFDLYRAVIARLRDYEGVVLVDCGTGLLDPPVRAALEAADQIVLVTDSSASTARQVVAAATLLPAGAPTWLVANKMPERGSMLDLDQVIEAIPRLSGVTVVPVPSGQLAENVVTPGFSWPEAPPPWREPVRELAARLANNWRSLP